MSIETRLTADETPRAVPQGQTHLRYLDSLRALAALYVVMHHTKMMAYQGVASTKDEKLLLGVFHWGHQAVDLFIILSGFCLMLPVIRSGGILRGGAWRFYSKRARRILPPYLSAVALSLLLIKLVIGHKTGTLWDSVIPVTKAGLLAHLLLLQDFSANTSSQINYSLWSISVEWRIYFAFPLLLIGWLRLGPIKTIATAVVCSYLMLFVLERSPLQVNPNEESGIMPQYLALFALGMLGAEIAFGTSKRLCLIKSTYPWSLISTLLLLIAFAAYGIQWHGSHISLAIDDLIMGCGMAAVLIYSSSPNRLHYLLSWKPLAFIGTFAYSIYLLHGPLLQLLWQYAPRSLHHKPFIEFSFGVVVGLPIVVAASYVFYLCCERPFLNRRSTPVQIEEQPLTL